MALDDELRAAAKQRYGFADWPRADVTARGPVRTFLPDLAPRHPNLRLQHRVPLAPDGVRDVYVEADDPAARIMLSITRHPSADTAREGLLAELAALMAVRIPDCRDHGIGVGEACFCGLQQPEGHLWLVRRNLVIRLNSIGDRPVSVVAVAETLDEQIMAAPD